MKEYSKDEMTLQFGKDDYKWLLAKVNYLSGIDILDSFVESRKEKAADKNISFKKYPTGFSVETSEGFSSIRYAMQTDRIKYFVIEQQAQIIQNKSKSVVGRALVGGLLLGPLGAIVGGVSGVGDKSKKLSDYPDNILTICYDKNGKDDYMLFSVKDKHYKDVEKYLKAQFPAQYKNFNEIEQLREETKLTTTPISVADEIKKLMELVEVGALTHDEFDVEKKKLLNR